MIKSHCSGLRLVSLIMHCLSSVRGDSSQALPCVHACFHAGVVLVSADVSPVTGQAQDSPASVSRRQDKWTERDVLIRRNQIKPPSLRRQVTSGD